MLSYKTLAHQIIQLDTGFIKPGVAACYLVGSGDEFALVETGINSTVSDVEALLTLLNIKRDQLKYIIPTHVHLDHAGGVGLLMQKFPEAVLIVHPFGAAHMENPARLQAGAIAVYGEDEFKNTYGTLIPVDAERIIKADDLYQLVLGGRIFTFYDTPGHARHHFCIHDSLSNGIFTGDTFGLAYPQLSFDDKPFIFPTTTPVQFNPDEMKLSIQRLMSLKPDRLFLTHYGEIKATSYLLDEMNAQIDDFVRLTLQLDKSDNLVNELSSDLVQYLIDRKSRQGMSIDPVVVRDVIVADARLNAQGLAVWRDKQV